MRVFVYFNLHRKCFSIKALEGDQKGRVVAHSTTVLLEGCKFKVSEAGRQRVLREKRKNVHAGVCGTWHSAHIGPPAEGVKVIYNPYKYASFVEKGTEQPIYNAPLVIMDMMNSFPSIVSYSVAMVE